MYNYPYGYPYSPMQQYGPNNSQQYYQQQNQGQFTQSQQPQTNIIYVNGIEDVKNRPLPPNSNFAFMDNDNPILYRKTVDAQGRMSVEIFDIIPHKEKAIEMPNYALKSDIEQVKKELEELKNRLGKNIKE